MPPIVRSGPALPEGQRTMNPFAIIDGAADLITFVEAVFDGEERPEARTPMPSGSLIHAEAQIGDSVLQLADRQEAGHSRLRCCRSMSPMPRRSSIVPSHAGRTSSLR